MIKTVCLTISATTSLAGAGFHAAVIRFSKAVVSELQGTARLKVEANDPTDFYNTEDETALIDFFEKWLAIKLRAMPAKSEQNCYLSWQNSYSAHEFAPNYNPPDFAGTIICPMGRFDIAKLQTRLKTQGIKSLCKDMFVWANIEKDEYFYRNCALAIMWQDCTFAKGSRSEYDFDVNQTIITLLQQSLKISNKIPFPVQGYLELCEQNLIHPQDVKLLTSLNTDYMIGFREDIVRILQDGISFEIHGNFLHSYDEDDLSHVYGDEADENWHIVRVSKLLPIADEQEFRTGAFDGAHGEPQLFEIGDIICKAAFLGEVDEDGESYFQLVAQANAAYSDTDIGKWLFTFSFSNKASAAWAMNLLGTLQKTDNPSGDEPRVQ